MCHTVRRGATDPEHPRYRSIPHPNPTPLGASLCYTVAEGGAVLFRAAAASFRAERSTIQREQADRLANALPLPQIRLPFVFTSEIGLTEIEQLADEFTAGLAALG